MKNVYLQTQGRGVQGIHMEAILDERGLVNVLKISDLIHTCFPGGRMVHACKMGIRKKKKKAKQKRDHTHGSSGAGQGVYVEKECRVAFRALQRGREQNFKEMMKN